MSDGKRPTPRCRICRHPKHAAINEALLGGATLRAVAKQFGLGSIGVIHNHRQRGHIPLAMQAAAGAEKVLEAESLLAKLQMIEGDDRRILIKAEGARNFSAAIAAVRELRGVVDSVGRITGAIRDRATVTVELNVSESDSLKMAIVYLQRRGWKLIPPVETVALLNSPVNAPGEESQ